MGDLNPFLIRPGKEKGDMSDHLIYGLRLPRNWRLAPPESFSREARFADYTQLNSAGGKCFSWRVLSRKLYRKTAPAEILIIAPPGYQGSITGTPVKLLWDSEELRPICELPYPGQDIAPTFEHALSADIPALNLKLLEEIYTLLPYHVDIPRSAGYYPPYGVKKAYGKILKETRSYTLYEDHVVLHRVKRFHQSVYSSAEAVQLFHNHKEIYLDITTNSGYNSFHR